MIVSVPAAGKSLDRTKHADSGFVIFVDMIPKISSAWQRTELVEKELDTVKVKQSISIWPQMLYSVVKLSDNI